MKALCIVALSAFLISCATNPGTCALASPSDGWVSIEGKPDALHDDEKSSFGYYFEWFENENGDILKCSGPYRKTGCGEVSTLYIKKGDVWVSDGVQELIICSS